MSKRGMETQGGDERYGAMGGGRNDGGEVDKPQPATAAQLARRKILAAKGKGTPRGSRAGSPATALGGGGGGGGMGGGGQANSFPAFQPPPSANGFSFSVAGSTPAPSFGQTPAQPNGGTSFGGQQNGTPSFGGFGNTQSNNTGFSFGSNASQTQPQPQPQTNGFNPTTSFNFGQSQPNTASTPASSFNFGQTPAQSQEQPKTNGFNPSTSNIFGGQQSQQTNGGTPSSGLGQPSQEQTLKPSTTSFNFGQSQANGDKPATTGLFGSTAASTAPSQPNGTTTGLFGAAPAPATSSKPGESVFSGLSSNTNGTIKPGMFTASQTNGDRATTPQPTFSFGQAPSQQNAEETPKASNPFASFSKPSEEQGQKAAPVFNFGKQPQTNGEETPEPPNPFAGFGAPKQPEAEKPATQEKENNVPQTPSLFGDMGQQKKPETPFQFGRTQSQAQETPKQNLFSGLSQSHQQPNGAPNFTNGTSQQEDTSMFTPGNTPHKLSAASQPAQAASQHSAERATPADPDAGKSIFDRISRDAPATTPKPTFSFGAIGGSSTAQTEEPSNPNAGKSLFDRMTPRDPEPPATAPKPSTNIFSMPATSAAPSPPLFSAPADAPATVQRPASQLQQSVPSGKLSGSSAILRPAERTKLEQINEGLLSHLRSQDTSKDWTSILHYYTEQAAKLMGKDAVKAPVAPAQAQPVSQSAPSSDVSGSGNIFGGFGSGAFGPKPSAPATVTKSQPGMVHAMAPAPPGQSSRPPTQTPKPPSAMNIFSQAAQPPATAPVNRKRAAEEPAEAPATEKRTRPSESVQYPKLPDNASNTAKLFASTLDKPATKGSPSFGPPSDLMAKVREQKAAREAAQRAAETGGDETAAPASTSKPSTFQFSAPAETPKTPGFAFTPSTPAKETPPAVSAGSAFKPSNTFSFGGSAAAPAPNKSAETPKAPILGFKPSTSAESSSTGGSKPPSFGAPPAGGASSFLSAFGKKADAEDDAAKKRRMDEDYDSDEEDKATWEARDKAEQEAKRKAIEDAAKKGSGFKLPSSASGASSAPFAFKLPGAEKSVAKPAGPESDAGRGLFDRSTPAGKPSTPSLFSARTPSQDSSTSNPFSQTPGATPAFSFGAATPAKDPKTDKDKVQGEKAQGFGNNTWKPSTPIKFGGAPSGTESTTPAAQPPANPFAGLFGGAKGTPAPKDSDDAGKLAPPAMGFTFGAPKGVTSDVSRATTPGLTTDGEASIVGDNADEGEASADQQRQPDEQIEDMTALLPEERESEDLLFEVSMAKAMKLDSKAWVEKGKGPMYILRNKTTGRTRVLMKIAPLGRPVMNFEPMKAFEYTCERGKKIVQAVFVDHFEANKEKAGVPARFTIQVRESGDAGEIARVLEENKG